MAKIILRFHHNPEHLVNSPCWWMVAEENYGGENKSANGINDSVLDD